MNAPTRSPWGTVEHCTKVAEGIWSVSTSGHGGIKLDRERNAKVPKGARRAGGWYEEDCEWCLVALVFPEAFKEAERSWADATAKNWFPEEYEAITGRKVGLDESRELRRRAVIESTRDRFVTAAAYGSWHAQVPEGMVGVYARKLATGETACFLVPEGEYKYDGNGFVVDESRHARMGAL